MNEPEKLVYDRTANDVIYAKTLIEKMQKSTTTDSDKAEWFTGRVKGFWNYTDLNRIESWTIYLRDILSSYGYSANIVPLKIPRPSGKLPDGYTEVEYIQSNGTQYINTGFKPNQDSRIVFDFDPITATEEWYFGTRTSTSSGDRFSCLLAGNTGKIRTDYATKNIDTTVIPNGRTVIDKNKNDTRINGASFSTDAATFSCAYPLYLIAGDTSGKPNGHASLKLYSCTIYDDGVAVRNFVPCKNTSGIAGLYDAVGSKFYGNSGTGSFVTGKEIKIEKLSPTRWYEKDIPKQSDIDRIRRNVDALQNGFLSLPDWEKIIYNTTMDYNQANSLEWNMKQLYMWLENVVEATKLKQSNSIIMIAGGVLNG